MTTKNNQFLYLSDKLDILDQRLDDMERLMASQRNILLVQEENLRTHIRRTELLEAQVHPLNKFMYAAYGIVGFLTIIAALYGAFRS